MQKSPWLIVGIGASGIMLGYLTGVSSSPIAGVIVSSVFGAGVGLLVAREPKADSIKMHRNRHLDTAAQAQLMGMGLTVFCACFVIGTLGGALTKYEWMVLFEPKLTVPWAGDQDGVPKSPQEAWKWITFSRDAAALGLGPDEIKAIYKTNKDSTPLLSPDPSYGITPAWPSYHTIGTSDSPPLRPVAPSPVANLPDANLRYDISPLDIHNS